MQIILTHENSDFDAIASLLGAHKLYPHARPVLPRRVNRNVQAFLALYGTEFPFVRPEMLPRGQHIQRVILVDTQSLTYVRGMRKVKDVLVIDHHTPPKVLAEGWHFQGEMLGATTTLLVEAISSRLIPLSRAEATLLLAGIYEDTGALTYISTTARDLHAAAWLLDCGASLEIASEFLEHPLSSAQKAIYNDLLDHIETITLGGHTVIITWAISPPNTEEEISTLAHKLRDLLDPSALFILVEIGENTQLVARSTTNDINVADVAQHFGGRGHDRAAAALLRQRPVHEICAELRQIISDFVHPRVKVHDLMSRTVRTVQPDDTIASVAKRMLRTGHEGFPVVDMQERVVGLVTRNAVDRALQHKWDRQPVQRIMQVGEVVVSPEDSVERVRALMIESGWGQIPVVEVEENARPRVIGVVTRTDLIRMPLSAQEQQRQEIAHLLAQAFPVPLLTFIRQIGEYAAEEGHLIYFVGGLVRDMLLGQAIFDVDLVVEGDAIELGQALADTYGGEVRTYSRFGTVKWILPEGIWENQQAGESANRQISEPPPLRSSTNLPQYIDLVTARTEFYEHPTALPLVERSSIKQDLHRRDFTINTLAIRLDPQRWGELLDFYGGVEDLEQGIIRVLHSLSFVDDPTRILRAARFEARLDFHLDPRSEALIGEALPLLHRITGGRIRHELALIFKEARPEAVLDRLQELGALQEIEPALTSDDWLHEKFSQLRKLDLTHWGMEKAGCLYSHSRYLLYWMLFFYRLSLPVCRRLARHLLMPNLLVQRLEVLPRIPELLIQLERVEQPSAVVALLTPLMPEHIVLAWLLIDNVSTRTKLEHYIEEWQYVQHNITGNDLKAIGIPPGPIYREIFETLRNGRLDGTITSREEEIALARTWIDV
ncbi:MAG: CBS domain-containing protein [Anaerolineae bacterium]|nr:CBS domain-containing protein [Anaerolineae bacterium]